MIQKRNEVPMSFVSRAIGNALAALALVALSVAVLAGPPAPVRYKELPYLPDNAVRRVVVKPKDRGPVWLLTGFLNNYTPEYDQNMLDALKIKHWRNDGWWWSFYPTTEIQPFSALLDWGRAYHWEERLAGPLRLHKQGMAWQQLTRMIGTIRKTKHPKEELPAYYDHIVTIVKYCAEMGIPVDYWEVENEPAAGPYEGVQGFGFEGTWPEFLDYWDTVYDAIREAAPNAKIVGPSYGSCTAKTMEPFLAHCKEKGQRLDVLSWHEGNQQAMVKNPPPGYWVQPDLAQKNIGEIRSLVETKYPMLGIKEYHIDEWGSPIKYTGPGTQIAFFYYMDLAGIDRAAKAYWTDYDLCGILYNPKVPRTSYWAWTEYAAGDGVRLVTNTNDRYVVAIASRDDKLKTVRALVARSKRYSGAELPRLLPPVATKVDLEGLPISGNSEVTILHLGPGDGALLESDLPQLTTRKVMKTVGRKLTIRLDAVAENEVYSIRIAPVGTWAREDAQALAAAKAESLAPPSPEKILRDQHSEAVQAPPRQGLSG